MAKSNSSPKSDAMSTKADAIREELRLNPKSKIKVIIAALAAKGIEASYNHVYMIKTKAKAKKRKANREAAATAAPSGISNAATAVTKVRLLARDLGGLRNLQQLIDVLLQ